MSAQLILELVSQRPTARFCVVDLYVSKRSCYLINSSDLLLLKAAIPYFDFQVSPFSLIVIIAVWISLSYNACVVIKIP